MNFVVIWGLFLGLSVTAIPLAFSIGLTPLLFGLMSGKFTLTVIFQSIVSINESFTLLALPFFVLAGEIMSAGGIGKRITQFAFALVGWVPGGLALISVVASMIFGGVSGSAAADAAGGGRGHDPCDDQEGLRQELCRGRHRLGRNHRSHHPALHSHGALRLRVGRFARRPVHGRDRPGYPGRHLPDDLLPSSSPSRRGYPTESRLSFGEVVRSFLVCLPALFAPVIILGSIFTGIVTPTEAAVIAVVYAIVVGRWVYGDLEWRMIPGMLGRRGR